MASAFRFRLAAVLRMRRLALQTHQRAVAERLAALHGAGQQAERISRAISQQTAAARATLSSMSLPIAQAIWDRQQLARLRRESLESAALLDQHCAALVQERGALTEALKAVRSLERLEEKQRDAHRTEQARAERRDEDERTAMQFGCSVMRACESA